MKKESLKAFTKLYLNKDKDLMNKQLLSRSKQ